MVQSLVRSTYNRRVLVCSAAYGATLIGGEAWLHAHPVAVGSAGYVVALGPALCIVGIFVALGRYLIEEGDEYLRMLMARQALYASGLALTVATLWGFLESFGLAAHLPAFWLAVIWFAGLGVGKLVNRMTGRFRC